MANDYLAVNKTKQLGANTVRAADLLRELRGLASSLYAVGNHSNDGVTYATLEANFGLSSGTGANFLTLLGNLNNLLNTNATVAGDTRLAQLDEFVGRLTGQ